MQNHQSEEPELRVASMRSPLTTHASRISCLPGPSCQQGGEDDPDSDHAPEYWHIMRRHRRAICVCALAGALAGFLISLLRTPSYRAHTSIEVLNLNEDFMNMRRTSAVTTNENNADDVSEEQTQIRVLESEAVLDRVFNKLAHGSALANHRPRTPQSWHKLWNVSEPEHLTVRERLLSKAADSMKVRSTPRTRIIEITADSSDPKIAADFANAVVSEYIQENVDARWQSTQATSAWLSRELADARSRLENSETMLQNYARRSNLIFTNQDTQISNEKLQQLQQQFSAATADRIAKQSRYETAQGAAPDSLPDVLNDSGLRATQAKLDDLRREVASFSATYNPEYGKSKRAVAELDAMQAIFDHERSAILELIKNEYTEALKKERLLAAAYDAQAQVVTGDGQKAIQYQILKREADSNRQLYESMLQQMKEASIASAIHASNVRIVDPAKIPDMPFSPNVKIASGLGLFGGLLFSIGLAIVRERTNRTVQDPGDLQFWTSLPELGVIPKASIDAARRRIYGKNSLASAAATDLAVIVRDRMKPSMVTEAYRTVLTSILSLRANEPDVRTLVVTSAGSADGKTTVVSNLAAAMAEVGQHVLVIDADLRRPRIHTALGLRNEQGLGNLLGSETFSEGTFRSLIQRTSIAGLDALTSGAATDPAPKLLYSANLEHLFNAARKHYDTIIIDTPPMLQITDARIVARLADGVILVARAEKTPRKALAAANCRLLDDRVRVLGTVLTDWDPSRSSSGYYGYYPADYRFHQQRTSTATTVS